MKHYFFLLALLLCFTSCNDNNDPDLPTNTEHTLLMYLPWSGDATESGGWYNLISYFYNNITDIENSIKKHGLSSERVLVFISTSPTKATLFEIEHKKGQITRQTLKEYTNPAFTTAAGITSILKDVIAFAPADKYSMTVGCHGMGWIPVQPSSRSYSTEKMHWEYKNGPMTRYFGGSVTQFRTDISTFAQGISDAGIKMEYILFDDCYLSTVEVAYDLKDAADYIIACPTEIMAHGMPYDLIGHYLLSNPDYESIVNTFYDFYSTYTYEGDPYPHGTIGVTRCAELDNLAKVMKEINSKYTFDTSLLNSIQDMDGYTPTIFFDCGDYVAKLCTDPGLLSNFREQLNRTVPYKAHTEYYYSSSSGKKKINAYSGITISDPSVSSTASAKMNTAWYKATH